MEFEVLFSVIVRVALTLLTPVGEIVRYLIRKKSCIYKFEKVYVRLVLQARSLCIATPINRLY